MKKLLIALVSLLFVAGFISMAWAHGSNGSSYGSRGHGYSKHNSSRPSHPRFGGGFRQHRKHLHHGSLTHSKRRHLRRSRQLHRFPRIRNGIILGGSRFLQNRPLSSSPIERATARGIGVSPIMKAQERKTLQQAPRHSLSSRSYHYNNPEPWFLYGKGKEFRQMGLIPSLPQASQELK
jgi:hypothetical protein